MDAREGIAQEGLFRGIRAGMHSHAYLVSCPDASRARALIERAAALLCLGDENADIGSHPDYLCYDGARASMEDMHQMFEELRLLPFSRSVRVVFIENAHFLNEQKQNMILKTLEEPPEGTVFFLAGVESGLLPTVRSRCTAVRVPLMTQEAMEARLEEGGINPAQARRVAGACGGSLDAALNMADGGSAQELCDGALNMLFCALDAAPSFSVPRAWTAQAGRAAARQAVEFMLEFMRQTLAQAAKYGNSAGNTEAGKYAKKLSIGQISRIIEVLCGARRRLAANTPAGSVFGWMMAAITEIAVLYGSSCVD